MKKIDEQQFQREILSYQQEQDFLKHLTTLNTGSILLMVTFLEKFDQNPKFQILIWVALISFGISIVSCLIIHFISILDAERGANHKIGKVNLIFALVILVIAFGGFLSGLVSLILFALKNLG